MCACMFDELKITKKPKRVTFIVHFFIHALNDLYILEYRGDTPPKSDFFLTYFFKKKTNF